MDDLATPTPPPCCARCGGPIGIYEPLVYDDARRGAVTSAFLRLARDVGGVAEPARFFHVACHARMREAAVA